MTRLSRPPQRAQRDVFRRERRLPVGMVIRQLIVVLLLLSSGIGIVVYQRLRNKWTYDTGQPGDL